MLAPPNSDAHSVWRLAEYAHELRRTGDRVSALRLFAEASALKPENLDLRVEIVRELSALGRHNDARTEVDRILDEDPANAWASLERGLLLRSKGQFADAYEAFCVALQRLPGHSDILRLAAAAALRADRFQEALGLARRGARLRPDNVDMILVLAEAHGALGRDRERLELCLHARDLERFPTELPRVLADGDEAAVALLCADLSAAIAEGAVAYVQAANDALESAGRAAEMFSILRRAAAERPLSLEFLSIFETLAPQFGAIDEVTQAYARAIRAAPNDLELRLAHSRSLWRACRRLEALREVTPIVLDPVGRTKGLELAAEFAGDLGAWSLAAAFDVDPGEISVVRALQQSIIRAHEEGVESGLAELDRVEARTGSSPAFAATRLHLLRLFGRLSDALRAVPDDARLTDDDLPLWREATGALVEAGEFQRLEQVLEVSRRPEARALRALREGERLERCGFHEEARRHYLQSCEVEPSREGEARIARCALLTLELEEAQKFARLSLAPENVGPVRNLSQSHLGQMIEEFSIDRELLADLRGALAAKSPATRLSKLRRIIKTSPDQTAPAIQLLLELRRQGRMGAPRTARPARRANIPARIIQYWSSDTPPADVARMLGETARTASDWDYCLYDSRSALAYLREAYGSDVISAFLHAPTPQLQADVFRLAALCHDGGLYIDADDVLLVHPSSLVESDATLIVYQELWGTLANDVVGAAPAHPVIRLALERCVAAFNRGDRENPWIGSGPGLVSRAFADQWSLDPKAAWLRGVRTFQHHEACRAVAIHQPAAYKRPRVEETLERALRVIAAAAGR